MHYGLTPNGYESIEVGTEAGRTRRFYEYLDMTERGVIEGVNARGVGHAVAWREGKIYDPKGLTYKFNDRHAHGLSVARLWRLECQK
jgi:hypothetical protein